MGPRTDSQRGRVLAVITEGPSTSPEVAVETGLPLKHCCAHLRSLWQDGLLTRTLAPHLANGGRAPWLYTMATMQQTGPKMHIPASSGLQSAHNMQQTARK